ncbi:Transcription initiation factor IIB [Bonamia ostreae]|uniref:General transcription factor TFIIB n=1 Tax=Bonamia ostreae TaxID=126728 RepID=A0ABV2ARX7_9EUKA
MPKFSKYVEPIQPTCPECVQSVVVKDTREGQNVCTSCGLVLGHRIISDDTEWRTFSESNDKGVDMNRVGGPSHPLLEEEEVGSTQIGKGANNNHILTRNQIRASSGKSQQLFNHYKTIDEINYKLKLSGSVKVITQSIFKQLFDLGEVKGRNKDNLIVACSYIACKLDGVPRTIKELCANSGMRRRDVGRSYLNIQRLQQNGKIKIRRSKGDSLAEKNSHRFVVFSHFSQFFKIFFQINISPNF